MYYHLDFIREYDVDNNLVIIFKHMLAVDYCREVSCENGGTCTNGEITFLCLCTRGYSGKTCSLHAPTELRDLVALCRF